MNQKKWRYTPPFAISAPMKFCFRLCFCILISLFSASAFAATYDVIIRNGRVIDGAGNPAYFADIAITNGKIAAIGRIDGDARTELDAKGDVVAPGFIDVHTHADDITDLPLGENFVRMGVTTIVVGNCGGSELDLAKLFHNIEDKHVSPNVASLIGHNTVRGKAMGGSFMRPPTAEEMASMKTMVEQGMKDGAVGLSTGLIYLPGTFAKTPEIIELAKVASAYDGIYTSHMRDEGTGISNSLAELFRIAREAHIRAEISHIKLSGNASWNKADQVLAAIEQARAEGLDITEDQYAYTASSTGIGQLVPDAALEGGHKKFLERLTDPKQKAEIIDGMKAMLAKNGRTNYAYAVIAYYDHNTNLNGLNIPEAAKAVRGSDSIEDQMEVILDIETHHGASGVFHGMNEADLQKFMQFPNTMIASDSGVREFGKGFPHPRGYGDNARVLAHYVRDLRILRLEDAIRKMTSLPAETFRFKDRGLLREGNWADVVVFDPATVEEHSTYKDPHHYATGFKYVLVNGVTVVENDKHTGAKPGMALRHAIPPQLTAKSLP